MRANKEENSRSPVIQIEVIIPRKRPVSPTRLRKKALRAEWLALIRVNQKPMSR